MYLCLHVSIHDISLIFQLYCINDVVVIWFHKSEISKMFHSQAYHNRIVYFKLISYSAFSHTHSWNTYFKKKVALRIFNKNNTFFFSGQGRVKKMFPPLTTTVSKIKFGFLESLSFFRIKWKYLHCIAFVFIGYN